MRLRPWRPPKPSSRCPGPAECRVSSQRGLRCPTLEASPRSDCGGAVRRIRSWHPPGVTDSHGADVHLLLAWFAVTGRDLPWRSHHRDPWAVLVSEVMLQQTPVQRVAPYFESWLQRWPTPTDLASEPAGAAIRMWGRLGYPRRALRLHSAATITVHEHGGLLPDTYPGLRSLPGVGDYTAAAVLAFSHRKRIPVLDTNVRRVLARWLAGQELPPAGAAGTAERRVLESLLPAGGEAAATLSEALMELGALVCTVRNPDCVGCPLGASCAWVASDRPPAGQRQPAQARFAGSDRQVRGMILAAVRGSSEPVAQSRIDALWPDREQLLRAQNSLQRDGLIEVNDSTLLLPN